jgi:predicted ribosome-associated RNA-binding protein Tma20
MLPQFLPAKRVKINGSRPSSQEIYTPAAKFPGTRSGEEEPNSPTLDESMHLMQKNGQPLNFVHDDKLCPTLEFFSDAARVLAQCHEHRGI